MFREKLIYSYLSDTQTIYIKFSVHSRIKHSSIENSLKMNVKRRNQEVWYILC